YRDSLLYMESLLRQTPPTDENLYIGHKAAIDQVAYQLDPAIQALKQPRQRILLADAVGLGKTIEVGILLSELIKRGKGKRILVLAIKSMLTQFQKELWSRFSIPLTRVDSIGIQRIRSRIPTSHNPFYYFDKSIISIDTLKNDAEYRTYLEQCYWDIIVIDEAQNVAERGSHSLRSRLVKLLSSRSDTLIMLSATPHDGKPKSFASLMNMLNPTAIANPENYGPEDIKGLFIRRFKKDIKDQVTGTFKERKIFQIWCKASNTEEEVFDTFVNMKFSRLDQHRTGSILFKTTLEKALFSSPAACIKTTQNRIKTLQNREAPVFNSDIQLLKQFEKAVGNINPDNFNKYRKLIAIIQDKKDGLGWTGKDTQDRLVIFTERIDTLNFLQKNFIRDLELKDNEVAILHGAMGDIEQQKIVEDFGNETTPLRLLIASDVASEGINLHYLCHKMIHFDIPWSLMVFQQRNGRIDRYGQERQPLIYYLITESVNEKIRGDTRILELLIEKDEQAMKNIGDPSFFMGVYDQEEEEKITGKAIEDNLAKDEFEERLEQTTVDPLALLMGNEKTPLGETADASTRYMSSLFPDDYAYVKEAIEYLKRTNKLQVELSDKNQTINLTAPKELDYRFKFMPPQIIPENGAFILSADREIIRNEITYSRKNEENWPRIQLLWELHPIVQWINDKVVAAFGRHEAPVITLSETIDQGEIIFIMSGLIPNQKSHPLIHNWFGVRFIQGNYNDVLTFENILETCRLHQKKHPNKNTKIEIENLKSLLPKAVEKAEDWILHKRKEFEDYINPKLNEQLEAREILKAKKYKHLDQIYGDKSLLTPIQLEKREREEREIEKIFEEFFDWIETTMTTEDSAYIRVVAVLKGEN
ncbi:MAG: helicase, partial [Candidatus Schekmanbacteria bacterium RBG_13_48_7]